MAPNRVPGLRRWSLLTKGCSGTKSSGWSARPTQRSPRSHIQSLPSPQAPIRTCSFSGRLIRTVATPSGVRIAFHHPPAEKRATILPNGARVARKSRNRPSSSISDSRSGAGWSDKPRPAVMRLHHQGRKRAGRGEPIGFRPCRPVSHARFAAPSPGRRWRVPCWRSAPP